MKNLLTVDLEDWFSVEVLKDALPPDTWEELESVVEPSTLEVLDIFDEHKVRATFFVLGWVADKHPELIQEVARRGHEIACHSYHHRMVSSLTRDEFIKDTHLAINAIVKACSRMPLGYRSPTWGMHSDMQWAFDVLAELGFEYDSSIHPIKHDLYGRSGDPRHAYLVSTSSGKSIIEIPARSTRNGIAVGGGGWLRHHPYWFNKREFKRLNDRQMPMMVYFHPWEVHGNLPEKRLLTYLKLKRGSVKDWLRQNMGMITMRAKLKNLLDDFEFIPMEEFVAAFKSERKES